MTCPIPRAPAQHDGGDELTTARQREVLATILAHTLTQGYPPTLRQIGATLGIRSTNGVNEHLAALVRKRCLLRGDNKARSLVLTTTGRELAERHLRESAEGRVP